MELKKPEVKQEQKPAVSPIDKAEDYIKRLEEANAKLEANIQRASELKLIQQMSGTAEAGHEPQKPKEESPEEYAERALRGDLDAKD